MNSVVFFFLANKFPSRRLLMNNQSLGCKNLPRGLFIFPVNTMDPECVFFGALIQLSRYDDQSTIDIDVDRKKT